MEGNGAGLSAVNHPPTLGSCLSFSVQASLHITVPTLREQVSRDLCMNRIKYAILHRQIDLKVPAPGTQMHELLF